MKLYTTLQPKNQLSITKIVRSRIGDEPSGSFVPVKVDRPSIEIKVILSQTFLQDTSLI